MSLVLKVFDVRRSPEMSQFILKGPQLHFTALHATDVEKFI